MDEKGLEMIIACNFLKTSYVGNSARFCLKQTKSLIGKINIHFSMSVFSKHLIPQGS